MRDTPGGTGIGIGLDGRSAMTNPAHRGSIMALDRKGHCLTIKIRIR
jgi:hypothetical protein